MIKKKSRKTVYKINILTKVCLLPCNNQYNNLIIIFVILDLKYLNLSELWYKSWNITKNAN